MSPAGAANRGLNNAQNVVIVDLDCLAQIALQRLLETKKKHPADAHETYFQANGENYRIRIERIPNDGKGMLSVRN